MNSLEHRARSFIKRHPALYFPLSRMQGTKDQRLVYKHTDLCVEGFPRSANSFVAGMIGSSQGKDFQLAHHTHAPAQIIRACKLNVPTLVLIRKPIDAVISLRALELEICKRQNKKNGKANFKNSIEEWVQFYNRVLPYRNNYSIGTFGKVVNDMDAVIKSLNARFNTNISLAGANKKRVQDRGFHALPNPTRDQLKLDVKAEFDKEKSNNERLIQDALKLYSKFTSR